MKRIALVVMALVLGPWSCKPDAPTQPPPADAGMPPGQLNGGQTPLACASGGTGRDRAEDCPFVVGNCCYETQEEGCLAAGCDPQSCVVAESYPAQPMCM